MKIILPKMAPELDPAYGPLFFLAGPVRGGGNWQAHCCLGLRQRLPNCYAALPCRYPPNHPMMIMFSVADGGKGRFARQLSWERFYLEDAAKKREKGCIIFWLPEESKTHPHPGPEPYAMDTRGELGEWRGRMMHDPSIRLVVGAEPGFIGLSQIQRNFDQALHTDFPIYATLEETIDAAIRMTA